MNDISSQPNLTPSEPQDFSQSGDKNISPVNQPMQSQQGDPLTLIQRKLAELDSQRTEQDSPHNRKIRREQEAYFRGLFTTHSEEVLKKLAIENQTFRDLYVKEKGKEFAQTPVGIPQDPLVIINKQVALFKELLESYAQTLPEQERQHFLKNRLTPNVAAKRRTLMRQFVAKNPTQAEAVSHKSKYLTKIVLKPKNEGKETQQTLSPTQLVGAAESITQNEKAVSSVVTTPQESLEPAVLEEKPIQEMPIQEKPLTEVAVSEDTMLNLKPEMPIEDTNPVSQVLEDTPPVSDEHVVDKPVSVLGTPVSQIDTPELPKVEIPQSYPETPTISQVSPESFSEEVVQEEEPKKQGGFLSRLFGRGK